MLVQELYEVYLTLLFREDLLSSEHSGFVNNVPVWLNVVRPWSLDGRLLTPGISSKGAFSGFLLHHGAVPLTGVPCVVAGWTDAKVLTMTSTVLLKDLLSIVSMVVAIKHADSLVPLDRRRLIMMELPLGKHKLPS